VIPDEEERIIGVCAAIPDHPANLGACHQRGHRCTFGARPDARARHPEFAAIETSE